MNGKSEELRNDIAALRALAETVKSEANSLIERSKEIGKEIDKRTLPTSEKTNIKINAA